MKSTLLLVILFFTAFSSLIYELVWTRKLGHVFGTSALAGSTVLAIFMAGLALGSLYGGGLLMRSKRPYRFLAMLQLAIAVSCLVALAIFNNLPNFYRTLFESLGGSSPFLFNLVLFVVAAVVLVVPTFLIGVAFPAIVHLYHQERQKVGMTVGSAYMVDTIGGALGILLAAFYLVSTIGFWRVSLTASAINLVLAVMALTLFREEDSAIPAPPDAPEDTDQRVSLPSKIMLFLFFLSGMGALIFEVIWIRHVSLIYGGSMHAFAIVVVSFLGGLGIGSLLHNILLKNIKNKVALFAGIEIAIGASGLLLTALFPQAEILFLKIYQANDTYSGLMFSLGAVCVLALLIPTVLMGMTLPVLSSVFAKSEQIGKDVGKLFAVNSFGALCGSFSAGFLIIPSLGVYYSAIVAAAIYLFIAIAFIVCFEPGAETRRVSLAALIAVGVLSLAGFRTLHDPQHIYNGAFYLATAYDSDIDGFVKRREVARKLLRFLEHSPYGQVAVFGGGRSGVPITLTNNGKVEASSDPAGVATLTMIAHIPITLHDNPRDVLNIGMGGGWTTAATLSHDAVKNAVTVEIDPVVVKANLQALYDYNHNPLVHPKSRVVVADGRNYIQNSTEKYDIIISEPPEIWVSGVSGLFTEQFYRSALATLKPGGMLCQWFPRYDLTDEDYGIALNTIRSVFPYVYEFDMTPITKLEQFQELVIIASAEPLDVPALLERNAQRFAAAGEEGQFELQLTQTVKGLISRDDAQIAADIASVDTINRDDLPILEFHTLRNRFRKFRLDR
ncbi:hypothetical protein ABI59_03725 [Acidobacteria bacterium Mor1]|nr:hypothetical protein ABI59_03725 [Acidobacteria bacterium Mor1]